jgi:predicted nucleotidyltransferase
MQNPHARWRTAYARRLAQKIILFEGVRAVVVAGSVARNYADEYSDIEIPIFWEALPDDDVRLSIVKALQARFLFAYDGPAREDQLLVNGIQVDLWHITLDHQEDVIEGVLTRNCTDLGSLNAMDTIRCCIPLCGDEIVQQWKVRAQQYPLDLAKSIIQEHLQSFRVDQLSVFAQRNDPTGFLSELTWLQKEAFLVLLALNQRYFPTFKWLYQSLETMPLKPHSIANRFRSACATPQAAAVADTQSVLLEIVQLIEDRFPEIDTALARRRLEHRRCVPEMPFNS